MTVQVQHRSTSPARKTRARGFANWKPRQSTLDLVHDVQAVLAEYEEHLPMTLRQVFYRLVATRGFDKTEAAYARLCETCNRARRAGMIPFSSIRDDGSSRYQSAFWDDAEHFLCDTRDKVSRFRLDRQHGQSVRLWVLCEAGGMAPMLARVANPSGIPVLTSGGFDSLTAKHDLARELVVTMREDMGAEVLHIGDLDPSGEHLFASLAEDVGAMCETLCGARPGFTRLAVTRAQAVEFDLPTAPAKPTDNRRFTGSTVQAEALDPETLTGILRSAIEARRDPGAEAETLSQEGQHRSALLAVMEGRA